MTLCLITPNTVYNCKRESHKKNKNIATWNNKKVKSGLKWIALFYLHPNIFVTGL